MSVSNTASQKRTCICLTCDLVLYELDLVNLPKDDWEANRYIADKNRGYIAERLHRSKGHVVRVYETGDPLGP